MRKYLIIFLLLGLPATKCLSEEAAPADFEAELRLLEEEQLEEVLADRLVEKLSDQNNFNRQDDLVEDTVSSEMSSTIRNTELRMPVIEKIKPPKIRRVPSR